MSDTPRDVISAASYAYAHRNFGAVVPKWETMPDWVRETWYPRTDAILAGLDAAGWTISRKMDFRALLGLPQQTPATTNPGSVPAGEAETATEGETGSQQQEDR